METINKSTKELILEKSIELFAENGYRAVTIRQIAAAVGIKGSSIYNHFKSREEILEGILQLHKESSNSFYGDLSRGKLEDDEKMTVEEFLVAAMNRSISFISMPQMEKIFRILSNEQLNNEKIRDFFKNEYIKNTRLAIAMMFNRLKELGKIRDDDSEFLAAEFHSYIIYRFYEDYLLAEDKIIDPVAMAKDFERHIHFFSRNLK